MSAEVDGERTIQTCSGNSNSPISFHAIYGTIHRFTRTVDYLAAEKQHILSQVALLSQRDIAWVEYLKAVGGLDNLKPVGIFRPSRDLKLLVRRGSFRRRITKWIIIAS